MAYVLKTCRVGNPPGTTWRRHSCLPRPHSCGRLALVSGAREVPEGTAGARAIPLSEDDVYRVAELFTNDACVDNTLRAFDDWSGYDQVGASAKYSLPLIKPDCPAGHVIHALARVLLPDKPNDIVRYAAIEFQVQR